MEATQAQSEDASGTWHSCQMQYYEIPISSLWTLYYLFPCPTVFLSRLFVSPTLGEYFNH